ncbi:MAG: site-specific DNA-methyltransferase [Candidatus Marinimicrobia bacterium]|nr:site-specific DNA-methyltransferase [Candidatus Neomarinimicrobiota bacterium]
MTNVARRYNTAESRWAGVGPYYAMFPVEFADSIIRKFTDPNDIVLDPFAGRGTAVYSAAIQGRIGVGIELNPVGWVYGQAKLSPAKYEDVIARIEDIAEMAPMYSKEAENLPVFFKHCFSPIVREFLLSARSQLGWSTQSVDWTAMALLLVYLHGKRGASLSNQMMQTKSMSPQYAIDWWEARDLTPPDIDPVEFMRKRIGWRYAKGLPTICASEIYLGDCTELISQLPISNSFIDVESVSLLFTSPPYYGVTNYHYDQWLRLWLLGDLPIAYSGRGRYRGKFGNREEYRNLLYRAFSQSSELLKGDAVVYVRTDRREFTYQVTIQILEEIFPGKKRSMIGRPYHGNTQTHLFGDHTSKPGEIDLILEP